MFNAKPELAVAMAAVLLGISAANSEDKTVQAVWKPQQIDFFYQSFSTFYSCDALEDRLEIILRALGAQDVKATASGCFTSGPSRTPHVKIEARVPVEATPEALADLKKDESTRKLTARVRGERPEEATAQFPATWKPVSLSIGQLGIQAGECELIDEVKRKVLPKLAIRTVKDQVSCMPYGSNFSQPRLEVEALIEAPKPDDKTQASDKKG
jgi:hypothetical protein